MHALEDIKVRLRSLITKKIDSRGWTGVRIFDSHGGCTMDIALPQSPGQSKRAISSDGFTFTELKDGVQQYSNTLLPHLYPVQTGFDEEHIGYCGERQLHLATQNADGIWSEQNRNLISSSRPMCPVGAWRYPAGNLVLYYEYQIVRGKMQYEAFLAMFDHAHPDDLIWKTEDPLWKSSKQWENVVIEPVGSALIDGVIIMYFRVDEHILFGVRLTGFPYDPSHIRKKTLSLEKHGSNPIISPRRSNDWEAFTTMNPAAVTLQGDVHILYRAQGFDYISSVGYARSRDGYHIDMRLDYPVYAPHADFETNSTGHANPQFMSAGGFGGCEDPRITVLGSRLYMTYVAYDGWSPPRLALTSIAVHDFLNQRWNWAKPVLISPPGIVDKSGCILPEKIRGQYVFFHRIFPDILIDYRDSLDFDGATEFLQGQYRISPRPGMWDSRKIGAGAPPIRTKDGWLLIYYGVDDRDASKYHLGAMILDIDHPEKVLYRTDQPILSPQDHYELNGFKPGIAYPCGAVVVRGTLLVYYGGADTVVCVAETSLEHFLSDLKSHKNPRLHTIQIRELTY